MVDVVHSPIDLPDCVASGIWKLMHRYNLRFAAIDMVVSVNGDWLFLEINPNGQWAWIDQKADTNIAELFVKAFSPDCHNAAKPR